MIEAIFLLALALIWIIFAAICDWKTTEIPDWLNFSLIIFALGARFFYSFFSADNFSFFFQGLIGLGIFFVVENLMYHGKIFGGGDAKLLLALGAILPLSSDFITNLKIFGSFMFLYLLSGSLWGIGASVIIALKNKMAFRREFKVLLRKNLGFIIGITILACLMIITGFIFDRLFLWLGILILALPFFFIFAKAIEESSMKKKILPKFLREGDLLYKDVKIGKDIIKAKWEGLSKSEIKLLKKKRIAVIIRQGIAFGPVFLISLLLLIYFYFINPILWNSFW